MYRQSWIKYKVEDIIFDLFDGPHATPKPSNSGSVFLGIKNISESNSLDLSQIRRISDSDFGKWTKRVLPKKDDLVFVYEATLDRYALIPDNLKCCLGRRMALLRLNKAMVSPKFLLYYFGSSEWKQTVNRNLIVGATVNRIPISEFPKFQLRLPKLKTQKSIAKVLSDLDAKIEVNNKINQELESMAKTLYDYWFVQFDFPMSEEYATSIGKPELAGKPYKASGGKMVFNRELKREIPEGWEVDSFSSWIKNDKSGDWGKEAEQGNYVNKVFCIRGADLNGLNGKGEVKSPTRYILEKNSHKLLEIGDFIIEISGGSPIQSTGRMAFITKETLERFENPLICSNFCKAVTLKEERALFNFAYEWNRLYDAGVLFGWEGKTSGIKNLLFESFVTNHQVAIPDSGIMEQFYNKAKPIHAQIQTNLKQNQKLAALRDWLLPMLMNGQVTVKDAYYEVDEELGMVAEEKVKY
ncbi:restriction endonuclease subunit S [Leeuwenhoekiella sp. A16]|uniref:restriction endonuclease subunit S n=1 Tax=Leeuwenhoekiella sp. A16 TaxID=3141462 RepID=UPI003A7FF088